MAPILTFRVCVKDSNWWTRDSRVPTYCKFRDNPPRFTSVIREKTWRTSDPSINARPRPVTSWVITHRKEREGDEGPGVSARRLRGDASCRCITSAPSGGRRQQGARPSDRGVVLLFGAGRGRTSESPTSSGGVSALTSIRRLSSVLDRYCHSSRPIRSPARDSYCHQL